MPNDISHNPCGFAFCIEGWVVNYMVTQGHPRWVPKLGGAALNWAVLDAAKSVM